MPCFISRSLNCSTYVPLRIPIDELFQLDTNHDPALRFSYSLHVLPASSKLIAGESRNPRRRLNDTRHLGDFPSQLSAMGNSLLRTPSLSPVQDVSTLVRSAQHVLQKREIVTRRLEIFTTVLFHQQECRDSGSAVTETTLISLA